MSTGALADQLGLSPASATAMVQKLAAKSLVHHVPRGAITLSSTGRRDALRMVRRHRLLETFLRDELGYGWDEVHDEAEELEHTVTDRFVDALDARLGYPRHDPHGDAIPSAHGLLPASQAIRLTALPALGPSSTGSATRIRSSCAVPQPRAWCPER